MNRWKIYYGDGSTCASWEFSPEDTPGRNVQAIVVNDPFIHGERVVLTRFDFYIWLNNRWYGCDQPGLWDYLGEPGLKIVKQGRTINDEVYHEIVKLAGHDPDFPLIYNGEEVSPCR